jgi:protein O-mannosyl-transferase
MASIIHTFTRFRTSRIIHLGLLFVLIFSVYSNVLSGPFLWDDEALVKNNPAITDWRNIPTFFSFSSWPTEDGTSFYRPIQLITYVCDYTVWGLNPYGYHLTNVFLHFLVCASMYFFFTAIISAPGAVFCATALFAVHPVHTEAVSYISGRADLLAAFFLVITVFGFYHLSVQKKKTLSVFLLLVTFLGALLSKEVATVACIVVFICIYRRKKRRVIQYVFIVGMIIVTALYWYLRLEATDVAIAYDIYGFSFTERLRLAVTVFAKYFILMLAPISLHMEYAVFPPERFRSPVFIYSALFALALVISSFYVGRKFRVKAALSTLWYIVFLLPVLNFVPINATFSEHWLYIPMIGITFLFAQIFSQISNKKVQVLFLCCNIVVLGLLGFRTYQRNHDWTDPARFYQGILDYNPYNVKVLYNLGNEYLRLKEYEKAIASYQKILAVSTRYDLRTRGQGADVLLIRLLTKTYNNLGNAYRARKDYQSALSAYEKSLMLSPEHMLTHKNIASLYRLLGKDANAQQHETYVNSISH